MKLTVKHKRNNDGDMEEYWPEAGLDDEVWSCECSMCRTTISEDMDDNNEGLCDGCLKGKIEFDEKEIERPW